MMTTRSFSVVSSGLKKRPFRRGIPRASKYRPLATRWSALMKFSPGGGVRPSMVIGPQAKKPLRGREVMPPAAVTPGNASSRAQRSR